MKGNTQSIPQLRPKIIVSGRQSKARKTIKVGKTKKIK